LDVAWEISEIFRPLVENPDRTTRATDPTYQGSGPADADRHRHPLGRDAHRGDRVLRRPGVRLRRELADEGDTAAARALDITGRLAFTLSGAQLGITVTALLVGTPASR